MGFACDFGFVFPAGMSETDGRYTRRETARRRGAPAAAVGGFLILTASSFLPQLASSREARFLHTSGSADRFFSLPFLPRFHCAALGFRYCDLIGPILIRESQEITCLHCQTCQPWKYVFGIRHVLCDNCAVSKTLITPSEGEGAIIPTW